MDHSPIGLKCEEQNKLAIIILAYCRCVATGNKNFTQIYVRPSIFCSFTPYTSHVMTHGY